MEWHMPLLQLKWKHWEGIRDTVKQIKSLTGPSSGAGNIISMSESSSTSPECLVSTDAWWRTELSGFTFTFQPATTATVEIFHSHQRYRMTSPILHLVLDNQKLSITGYVPNHHKCNTCIEILLHISTDIFTQSLNDELNHTQRCKKYETNNAKQPTNCVQCLEFASDDKARKITYTP